MTGKHRGTVEPRRIGRRSGLVLAGTTAAAILLPALWLAPDQQPTPTPATSITVTDAERDYLAELAYAGIRLNPTEQTAAVEIAREHVAHGHLIGMRIPIMDDFNERIPRLSDEQVDTARVAVEHHFKNVTGKPQ